MKNLKKVLALVLAFACAFTMFAGAAFTDQADIKATDAVNMLSSLGVITGYTDGSYQPNKVVTRAEMAKMIFVVRNNKIDDSAYQSNYSKLTDISNHWAKGYIKFCESQGIIAGKGNNKFDPDSPVTGVEAAKMLLVVSGYDSDKAGLTGSAWRTNVLKYAGAAGILDDVNSALEQGLPRQYAAQMIYNTLDVNRVKWSKDSESFDDVLNGGVKETVGHAYMGLTKSTGTLVTVKKDTLALDTNTIDGAESDAISTSTKNGVVSYKYADKFTKVSEDYTSLLGQKVKVLFKDGKTNSVLGVYPTSDNTAYTVNQADVDTDASKIKVNNTKLSLDSNGATVYVDGVETGKWTKAADFKDEKSADVLTLIDSDDDNDIDTVYVKTYTVGKVTYASSSSIIVNGKTYKYDDENIADGIKKDDWAIITENLFDDCKDIVKADMATTKVEATKNQGKDPSADKVQFKLDGTWYVVSDASSADIKNNAKSGVTVKAVTVNGILFYAEKTSGSDSTSTLTDVALVVAKGTGVDGKRVKLAFFDGTTKTVNVGDDANGAVTAANGIKDNTPAGTDVGYAALLVGGVYEYAVSGDEYTFTTIDTSDDSYGDYTALSNGFTASGAVETTLTSSTESAAQKFNTKKVADNATILLYDATNNDTKKITGKQYKSANDVAGGTIAFQAKIDGLKQVAAAVVTVNKIDGVYTSDDNYGYILSDAADVSGNSVTYKLWTTSGEVTVTEKTNKANLRKARTIIGYSNIKDDSSVASGKLIEDVKVATVKTGALNFNGTKNAYDQIGTNAQYKYNINSDTTVLYVDTKEKEGMETATFSDADDYNGVYVPNAYYIIDGTDGDDADLSLVIYDVTNKLYNAKAQTLTLSGSKTDIVATMEDSYNDAVDSGDTVGQGNLVTLNLKNTNSSAITVRVTITNAVFESGNKADTYRDVVVPANSTNSVSFTVDGTAAATVAIA